MRPKDTDPIINTLARLHEQGRSINDKIIEEVATTGRAKTRPGPAVKASVAVSSAALGTVAFGDTTFAQDQDTYVEAVDGTLDTTEETIDRDFPGLVDIDESEVAIVPIVDLDTSYEWEEPSVVSSTAQQAATSNTSEAISNGDESSSDNEKKWLVDMSGNGVTVIPLDIVISSNTSDHNDLERLSEAVTRARRDTMRPDGAFDRIIVAEATDRNRTVEETDRINDVIHAGASELNVQIVSWRNESQANPDYFETPDSSHLSPEGLIALQGLAGQIDTTAKDIVPPNTVASTSNQSIEPSAITNPGPSGETISVEPIDFTEVIDGASKEEKKRIFDQPIQQTGPHSTDSEESIYMMGDSLLDGLKIKGLQKALENEGFTVNDIDAVNGKRFSWGIETARSSENKEHVINSKVLVTAFGTNDSLNDILEDAPVAIRELHEVGSQDGDAPLVVLIAPVGTNPNLEVDAKIIELERIVAEAQAEGIDAVLYRRDIAMAESGLDQYFQADGVHLTSEGYELLAVQDAKAISQLLKEHELSLSTPIQNTENDEVLPIIDITETLDEEYFDDPIESVEVVEVVEPVVETVQPPVEEPQAIVNPESQTSQNVPRYEMSADGQTINIDKIYNFVLSETKLHPSGNACMINPYKINGLDSHVFTRGMEQRERLGTPEQIAFIIATAQVFGYLTENEFPEFKGSVLGVSDIHSPKSNGHIEHDEDDLAVDLTSIFIADNELSGAKAGDLGPAFVTGSNHFSVEFTSRMLEEMHKMRINGLGQDDYIIIRQQTGLEERLAHLRRHNSDSAGIFTRKPVWDHEDHVHLAFILRGNPLWADLYDPNNCADAWDDPEAYESEDTEPVITAPPVIEAPRQAEDSEDDIIDDLVEIIPIPDINIGDIEVDIPTPSAGDVIGLIDGVIETVTGEDEPISTNSVAAPQDEAVDDAEITTETTTEAYDIVLDLIASGEGNYDSMNRGRGGDTSAEEAVSRLGKKLTEMTVKEILQFQASGDLYAAGRYQIIPQTMPGAIQYAGVNLDEQFSEELQDRLAIGLIAGKRPHLDKYLRGEHNDLQGAMIALAKEWASFPDPRTGRSFHHGTGNNRSSHSVEQVSATLIAARNQIMSANS